MLKPGGYLVITDPTHVVEYDSTMCCHCGCHILVKPGSALTVYIYPQKDGTVLEEMGAWCSKCDKSVCLRCHDSGVCLPLDQWLQAQEALGRFSAQA